jgi:hypothetical protein
MMKKINSEYKVDNDNSSFIVTMGTSNKKSPDVIYSILSTYVTPNTNDINESIFDEVSKNVKKKLKTSITKLGICETDVIVVSDVASSRMLCGKPSFFDMQIYFKPQKDVIKTKSAKFKDVSNDIYNTYVKNIVNDIEETLSVNGFSTSKRKNKVVNEVK